ncbi:MULTISPECIES: hybrid sensor histidine kinase/response regulator [Myxococcus]|nr:MULTISPECIES: hybrid sensor histidine kinase/response regulator [Myxococcus]NOJ51288.1 hybrid sensor histidine kinase/response regulator [Myxococcus xanthus]QPM79143.1 hybrid sensor histidine kinase/response regulator [Myxococcus xanthus]QVW68221.1 hybrid sensor histidine kinase/response regulator [Myxococcus xanthus DZ2]UEO05665.1 hybrid sensor histidine kinase/response regulator [Myxococcus xanthus DZ2]UYI14096.1 hybrid sensor histidine kinase/response regulator [Myxococcus xanthus]
MPPSVIRDAPGEDAPRARVLLVDDTPANLLSLEAILEPLGQELVLARSGEEALRELLRGEFACILMDVQMPGLNGLETAHLIRARERTRYLPILFITALSREAAFVTRGYAQGAVDYLLKPVDPDILRAKVQVFVALYLRGEEVKRQAVELAERRRSEEAAQRASELEQQLMGIVGHDIRTPLSVVLTTAKSQLASGALEPAQQKAFERVARSGERIQHIVDLLTDFTRSRLGGGIPVIPRAGDLNELCREVVDELQVARPGRTIRCDFSRDSLHGVWDLERMGQVVANLLDNALKYSPEPSAVCLATWEKPDAVFLEVHNEGAPIPPSLLPHLFEPFQRGEDSRERARTSLGLGLYIARAVVEAHRGRLTVRSSEADGTTFRLCLPRRADARLPAGGASDAGTSPAPMTA